MTRDVAERVVFHAILALRLRARLGSLAQGEVEAVTDALDFTCFHGATLGSEVPDGLVRQSIGALVARFGEAYSELLLIVDDAATKAGRAGGPVTE